MLGVRPCPFLANRMSGLIFLIFNVGPARGSDPQGISGMAWASAQLRLADAPYSDAASHAVHARSTESGLSHFKFDCDHSGFRFLHLLKGAQEISNIIRACGKSRYQQPSSA